MIIVDVGQWRALPLHSSVDPGTDVPLSAASRARMASRVTAFSAADNPGVTAIR